MQTLYIDVYFLINFTVDFLSLYFSSLFSKVPTSSKRLLISATLGAVAAVFIIFLPEIPILKMASLLLSMCLFGYIAVNKVSFKRRARFIISFFIFEALVGGVVSFLWDTFDKYLYDNISSADSAPINRKMLFFSVIILILVGVFKMIVSFFSNIVSEGTAEVEIRYCDKTVRCEAFIDSGNLAKDPMDMQPVIFIKEELAVKLLPNNLINLCDPDTLSRDVRKRIRLIPVSRGGVTHVLTGIKVDSIFICKEKELVPISATIAIDKEKGSYDGFFVLLPSRVACDAEL